MDHVLPQPVVCQNHIFAQQSTPPLLVAGPLCNKLLAPTRMCPEIEVKSYCGALAPWDPLLVALGGRLDALAAAESAADALVQLPQLALLA